MRFLLTLLAVLFGVTAYAASPTFQQFNSNQFDTTGNRVAIEGGALLTNTFFYPSSLDPATSAFGTDRFRFRQPGAATFSLWDHTATADIFAWNSSAEIFNVLGGVTAVDFVANNSITLGGELRTTWPSGSSGPFTNVSIYSADNIPASDQGPSISLRPQEVTTSLASGYAPMFIYPSYTNTNFKGRMLFYNSNVTNTLGDLRPDIIFGWGYNSGGNSAGAGPYGLTDTNEPVWQSQRESRWQNLGSLSQLEWWDAVGTPYTDFGTNFFTRWWSGTLIWETTNRSYVRMEAALNAGLFEILNPRATNAIFGVQYTANNADLYSFTETIRGSLVIETNDAGNGSAILKGGFLSARAPDSVSSIGGINIETDWNNSDGFKPHANFYNSGTAKGLYIGIPGDTSKTFTNTIVASNFVALGYATFPRGLSANSNVFTLPPTNYPSANGDVIVSTGTNAAGAVTTAWGSGGSGANYEYPNAQAFIVMDGSDPIGTVKHSDDTDAIIIENDPTKSISIGAASSTVLLRENGKTGISIGNNVRQAIADDGSTVAIDWGAVNLPVISGYTWDYTTAAVGYSPVVTGIGSIAFEPASSLAALYSGFYTNDAAANSYKTTNHITFEGNVSMGAILGTTTGNDAPAGTLGEAFTNTLASGSAVSLTTATTANITSISLNAGDWYICGVGAFNPAATTTTEYLKVGISTTSATLGALGSYTSLPIAVTLNSEDAEVPTPAFRINLTSTTTVYLVARAGFAVDTMAAYGRLFAWRER